VTNDRPWRLADLSFAPSGNGRERATINGVEVVRENGRYWITTPNGPIWSNIDERGVDPALNYLFGKRKQEQSRGTRVFPSDSLGRPRRRWPLSISIAEGLDVIRQQFCKFVAAGQRQPATLHIKEVLSGLIGECYLGPLPRFIGMTVALLNFLAEFLEHDAPPRVTGGERDRSLSHRRLNFVCYWPTMETTYANLLPIAREIRLTKSGLWIWRLLCGTLHFLLPGGGHPHMNRRNFISTISSLCSKPNPSCRGAFG
jgi:hypothetical protein